MKRLITLGIVGACLLLGATSVLAQENVTWTNQVGTTSAANTLTKAAASTGWDSGASSTRAIGSGDGYAEFTVTQNNVYWMAGLSNGDSNTDWHDIDYAIYVCGNGWAYAFDETGKYWLGPYTAGATLRVQIASGNVRYSMNNIVLVQHATTPNYPLLLDSAVFTSGGVVSEAVLSGSLIDARDIQDVVWTNKVFASDGGTSTLTKTGQWNGWAAGGSSTKAIESGDGYAEFTVAQNNTYVMAGLSNGDSDADWVDIDYAIYAAGNGFAYAYDATGKYWLGAYGAGTRFRVEIQGSTVLYIVDGIVKAQHATAPTYPLVVDSSIYTPNAAVEDAIIAGKLIDANNIQSVVWKNMVGTGAAGNTLTKTSPNAGFESGASSIAAIQSGNGYAEFTVTQANVYWMAGLSNGDTDVSWQDIDYALYICGNGWSYVFDDAGKHWIGPYTAGDTFRVEIQNGSVLYKQNGVTVYQHLTTPNYPLLLDTSMYTPNAVISNAILAGANLQ